MKGKKEAYSLIKEYAFLRLHTIFISSFFKSFHRIDPFVLFFHPFSPCIFWTHFGKTLIEHKFFKRRKECIKI